MTRSRTKLLWLGSLLATLAVLAVSYEQITEGFQMIRDELSADSAQPLMIDQNMASQAMGGAENHAMEVQGHYYYGYGFYSYYNSSEIVIYIVMLMSFLPIKFMMFIPGAAPMCAFGLCCCDGEGNDQDGCSAKCWSSANYTLFAVDLLFDIGCLITIAAIAPDVTGWWIGLAAFSLPTWFHFWLAGRLEKIAANRANNPVAPAIAANRANNPVAPAVFRANVNRAAVQSLALRVRAAQPMQMQANVPTASASPVRYCVSCGGPYALPNPAPAAVNCPHCQFSIVVQTGVPVATAQPAAYARPAYGQPASFQPQTHAQPSMPAYSSAVASAVPQYAPPSYSAYAGNVDPAAKPY